MNTITYNRIKPLYRMADLKFSTKPTNLTECSNLLRQVDRRLGELKLSSKADKNTMNMLRDSIMDVSMFVYAETERPMVLNPQPLINPFVSIPPVTCSSPTTGTPTANPETVPNNLS